MSRTGRWGDGDFALDVDAAYVQGPSPRAFLLLLIISALLGGGGYWAHHAIIDEVTHAEGKVIPSSQVQIIQNLEGGILKATLVSEGDTVETGDVLLQIDNTGVVAGLGALRSRQANLLGEIQRLTAEVEGTGLTFSPELKVKHREIALSQRDLFRARETELKSMQSIVRRQADQRRQEKIELEAQMGQLTETLKLLQEEIDITKPLVDNGVVPKIQLLRLRRDASELNGKIVATKLAIPRANSAIQEANRRIEEKFHAFRAEALRQLSEKRGELSSVNEKLAAARDRVVRTDVRAPVRGIVKSLKKNTIGGVIKPGEDLVELVPIDDGLLIEAQISPRDIAFLRADQDAMVKLTAYDFSIYGGLPGKLVQIGADTSRDEKGKEYYKIVVRTEHNELIRGPERLAIIPGMVATVDVLTGRKSILSYLLKPILKVRDRALTER